MRSRLLLAAAIVAVVIGAIVYVVRTTDHPVSVQVGNAARGAFDTSGALASNAKRALYSPDGTRLAVIASDGIGIADHGQVHLVSETDTAVDAAWMPDSTSLLIGEGPADADRLTVLSLTGDVKGVAHLDHPFSLGEGNGMAVDGRGARAVVTAETRDAIGGRRHFDLMLVDLTSGHTTGLTNTPGVDESWPVFVGDDTVLFTQSRQGDAGTVQSLDLSSGSRTQLSPDGEDATTAGVVRGTLPIYSSAEPGHDIGIWAQDRPGARRQRLGTVPAGTRVWSVDPAGSRAVVTERQLVNGDERVAVVRAVTLQAPSTG